MRARARVRLIAASAALGVLLSLFAALAPGGCVEGWSAQEARTSALIASETYIEGLLSGDSGMVASMTWGKSLLTLSSGGIGGGQSLLEALRLRAFGGYEPSMIVVESVSVEGGLAGGFDMPPGASSADRRCQVTFVASWPGTPATQVRIGLTCLVGPDGSVRVYDIQRH